MGENYNGFTRLPNDLVYDSSPLPPLPPSPDRLNPPTTRTWGEIFVWVSQVAVVTLSVVSLMVLAVVVIPSMFQLSGKIASLENQLETKSKILVDRDILLEESRKQAVINQASISYQQEMTKRINEENLRLVAEINKQLKKDKE